MTLSSFLFFPPSSFPPPPPPSCYPFKSFCEYSIRAPFTLCPTLFVCLFVLLFNCTFSKLRATWANMHPLTSSPKTVEHILQTCLCNNHTMALLCNTLVRTVYLSNGQLQCDEMALMCNLLSSFRKTVGYGFCLQYDHTPAHARTHTHTYTHAHTHTHARTHAHTHTHARARAHTHT